MGEGRDRSASRSLKERTPGRTPCTQEARTQGPTCGRVWGRSSISRPPAARTGTPARPHFRGHPELSTSIAAQERRPFSRATPAQFSAAWSPGKACGRPSPPGSRRAADTATLRSGLPGAPGIPGEGGSGDSSASFQTVRGRPRSERPEPPALNPPFLCLVGFSWNHFTVAPAEQPREGSARAWGAGFSGANRRSGSSPGRSYSPTAPPFSERMGGGGAHRPTGPGTAAGASRGRGATAAGEAAGQHAPGRRVRVRPEGC